jgi:hypothetical protein
MEDKRLHRIYRMETAGYTGYDQDFEIFILLDDKSKKQHLL